jgi:hypothetical protein
VPWLRLGLLHSVLLTGDGTFSIELNTCADLQKNRTRHASADMSNVSCTLLSASCYGGRHCTVRQCMQCKAFAKASECLCNIRTPHSHSTYRDQCHSAACQAS